MFSFLVSILQVAVTSENYYVVLLLSQEINFFHLFKFCNKSIIHSGCLLLE